MKKKIEIIIGEMFSFFMGVPWYWNLTFAATSYLLIDLWIQAHPSTGIENAILGGMPVIIKALIPAFFIFSMLWNWMNR